MHYVIFQPPPPKKKKVVCIKYDKIRCKENVFSGSNAKLMFLMFNFKNVCTESAFLNNNK